MGASLLPTVFGQSSAATSVDGDNVYLVFGADTSSTDLESWVENHKGAIEASSQRSSSPVLQYQNASQVNVNQQDNAVAISIDGGEADAVQRAVQNNENTQSENARSVSPSGENKERTFEDIGKVYVVFAEETECREFSGWVVSEDTYQAEPSAEATIGQVQEVDQLNYSSQSTAIALSEGGSRSSAYQRSYQRNESSQTADAVAANVGSGDSRNAEPSVVQSQNVTQVNASEQGVAVAVAVGRDSVAKARQITCQFNVSEQVADATAVSFDPKSVKEVTASAGMKGDFSDVNLTRSKDGSDQSNVQAASANVEQFQSVSQSNVSMQNAAVAVGLDESRATAAQVSYQANFSAQVADATALDIDVGHYDARKVLDGMNAEGDDSWAISYENGGTQANERLTDADLTQVQLVRQLNENKQNGAIAVAIHDGEASAEQLNLQINRSVQTAESAAVDVSADGGC